MSDLRSLRDSHTEFDRMESSARYYCRHMPAVFTKASNASIWDENGTEYTDFLAGCGSLNYGHNHPVLKAQVMNHLAMDGMVNGLDFHTTAKRDFLRSLRKTILEPRSLSYRIQFPGPTGTNAVESALKLARKVTGRRSVVGFTNAFHGMTLGSLSVSGKSHAGSSTGAYVCEVVRLPFDGYLGVGIEQLDLFSAMVDDPSGGVDAPAAFIVETVQGEGGLNVASTKWLRHLSQVARDLGAVLIVDDVQAGCGRTGTFFSFEEAGIEPDIVCLAKSISGIGLPMSLVLIRPDLDQWAPGEHNGTFRGNNLAFVAATSALGLWQDQVFLEHVSSTRKAIQDWIGSVVKMFGSEVVEARGVGLMSGLAFTDKAIAGVVAEEAFKRNLLIETSGPHGEVLKLMPPLTIERDQLDNGLQMLEAATEAALARAGRPSRSSAA